MIKKIYDLYITWAKEWSQSLNNTPEEAVPLKENRNKEYIINNYEYYFKFLKIIMINVQKQIIFLNKIF